MVDKPYDVRQYGTDTSGRPIFLNARMKLALDKVLARLDFTPTIVQGAYMARLGGGAADSAGYHDEGGCIDFRVWDLSGRQVDQLNRAWRSVAGPGWPRSQVHGAMDPHYHAVVDGDRDAGWGARDQMEQYREGFDGLAGRGPDYVWRPNPIPPPIDYYEALKEFELSAEDVRDINGHTDAAVKRAADRIVEVLRNQSEVSGTRNQRVLAAVDKLPPLLLTRKQVRDVVKKALSEQAEA